jgi:uncharacterized protein YjdB
MENQKKVLILSKCLLCMAVVMILTAVSGRSVQAAQEDTGPVDGLLISLGKMEQTQDTQTKSGGFHALSWGTLIPASGTAIAVTGKEYMKMGTTQQLSASCRNYNGDFIYSSNDTSVATVDSKGLVTAVTGGSVEITVQTEPITGSAVVCKGTLQLTVYHNSYADLSSLSVSIAGTSMSPGVKQMAKVTPYPSNAYVEPGYKFESSDYKIFTVDQNGVITALTPGTATLTVSSKEGLNIKGTATVTVESTKDISVTGLELSGEKNMVLGEKQTLLGFVTPVNASVPTLSFKSTSESVASVSSDGTITAVGVGTADIIVSTQDGSNVSSSISITVTGKKVEKITVSGKSAMEVGDTQTLTTVIEPSDATDRSLQYSSSDTDIATVSTKGFVSANDVGTVTITVQTTDGSNLSSSITITVSEKQIKVSSIALNLPGEKEMAVDESRTITAIAFPLDATNPELEWYSSNEDVLTVDSDGMITGVEAGNAIIIVSATDGSGITARLDVTVYAPSGTPKSISLDGNTKMTIDTEQTLAVVLNPERTEMPDLEWESSNEDVLNVYDGVVSADGLGKAVITATDGESLKASITITVVSDEYDEDDDEESEEIFLQNTSDILEMKEGETFTVRTNYQVGMSTQYLTWKTSNSVVASVNQDGKITARRYGTAKITIATMNGEYKETIKVIVSKKEYNVSFTNLTSKNKLKLKRGRSKIIKVSMTADGAKAVSYTWATSKKSVAKVTEKGRVSGVEKGKAVITLKVNLTNGKTLKKSFTVVVKK